MISPAQQQLDEALTAAGHSDNCPAWSGHACAGPPICEGAPVDDGLLAAVRGEHAAQPQRVVSEVRPRSGAVVYHGDRPPVLLDPPSITLTGPAAAALAEYERAAKELKHADEYHRRAVELFNRAHQAFAEELAKR